MNDFTSVEHEMFLKLTSFELRNKLISFFHRSVVRSFFTCSLSDNKIGSEYFLLKIVIGAEFRASVTEINKLF